ncbi:hypothetical protein HIM_06991 [Hirsutella minnesotensis 3608]|uniref:Condensation domain-containing protein n=1 Tax=Hirsutella minnesotensis 3608 TaxID=1043627 RepID=A0A0F7ZTT2_9HYPO|nr:hypothetical protein HIM_06991 [Hirsutella minnesotensis 3608]
MTTPSLTWHSTPDGTRHRALDSFELFLRMLSESEAAIEREHFAITLAVRLSFPDGVTDAEPYVRRAWLRLRRLHPTLGGSVTAPSADARILSVGPLDEQAWLSTTFRAHAPDDRDAADSSRLFTHGSVRPADTVLCHWLPASSEVCIRAAHWRVDAIGLLLLGHSFLSTLASVIGSGLDAESTVPTELGPLTPSLFELIDSFADEESTPPALKSIADSIVSGVVRGGPSIALPIKETPAPDGPGATLREATTLDESTTSAIIAATKTKGISVTSALHAAIVRVTAAFPQHPLAKSYATFCPADVRRHLSSPYNQDAYAVANYFSALPICVPDVVDETMGWAKSFDAVAAELDTIYSQGLDKMSTDDAGNPVGIQKLLGPLTRRVVKLCTTPPPPELPQAQNAEFSSVGRINSYMRHEYAIDTTQGQALGVSGMWLGLEVTTRSVHFHAWTFRNELTLQACFNSNFYDRDFVVEVLDKIKQELFLGIGIEQSADA